MSELIAAITNSQIKKQVADIRSGDTVRVHQKIREGEKERVQIYEGLVIRTQRMGSHTASITVRRIASGVGVERKFMIHSPLVVKIDVTKRSKVRRNYLSYMRERSGKSARLESVKFDRDSVNVQEVEPEPAAPADETPAEVAEPAATEPVVEAVAEAPAETKTEDAA